ncbi:hypothetical protein DW988_16870, partial [Bacteroides uniformis]
RGMQENGWKCGSKVMENKFQSGFIKNQNRRKTFYCFPPIHIVSRTPQIKRSNLFRLISVLQVH